MIKTHSNGTLLLKFGAGGIGMCMGGEEGCGVLMFYDEDPREPLGAGNHGSVGFARTCDFPVSMTFSSLESIDGLINSLETVKKVMEGRLIILPFGTDKVRNIS
ncbi:MAG: hypothetical protein FWE91_10135 [Defluviitaleaceae bacterium]|nr:hypothetical protein [Defluviitaleaceae bacterium]